MAEKLTHSMHFTRDEIDALRDLATDLSYYYRTGPLAHEMGNPKLLMAAIARAYRADPITTRERIRTIVQPVENPPSN